MIPHFPTSPFKNTTATALHNLLKASFRDTKTTRHTLPFHHIVKVLYFSISKCSIPRWVFVPAWTWKDPSPSYMLWGTKAEKNMEVLEYWYLLSGTGTLFISHWNEYHLPYRILLYFTLDCFLSGTKVARKIEMRHSSVEKLHQGCPQLAPSSSLGTRLFPGLDKTYPMCFSQLLIPGFSIQRVGVQFFTQVIKYLCCFPTELWQPLKKKIKWITTKQNTNSKCSRTCMNANIHILLLTFANQCMKTEKAHSYQ